MIGRALAARVLMGVAAGGLVIAVVVVPIAWTFVGQTERTARHSLDLTTDAVSSVSDTIDVARTMLDTIADALTTVDTTLGQVNSSFDTMQSLLQTVSGFAGEPLPAAIESVTSALPGLADVGDAVDRSLRTLARLPLGISYDPSVPFGDSVRRLGTSLTGLPEQLRGLSATLAQASDSTTGLRADLGALRRDLAATNTQLTQARSLLNRYAATAHDARDLAVQTRADVRIQARNGRILVAAAGLGFIAMQLVPLVVALAWWRRPPHGTSADGPSVV